MLVAGSFDLQLEEFGVNTAALKAPAPPTQRVFRAWVEDWEAEYRYNNDVVAEQTLLTKYKGLVFQDPDTGNVFSVYKGNLEFRRGKGNGWFVIGVNADDEDEMEPFSLEVACDCIGSTAQADGIKVVQKEDGEEE